jgi:mono/diheme cytochrome c family protein
MAKLPDAPPPATVVNPPVAGAPTNAAHAMTARTEAERARNMQSALGDRQAVLKGECAKCHVEPAVGKKGKDLFVAACGICHNAERRAAMVVDLQADPTKYKSMPPEFWNMFITMGKPGTLMPAFAKENGGFLTQDQITSLVDYITKDFFNGERIIYRDTPMEHATNVTHTSSVEIKPANLLPAALGAFAVPDATK